MYREPHLSNHMRGSRGGRGSGPTVKNHKTIGFLSNTGADPVKNHKATKPAFNVEPAKRPFINSPFK